MICYSNGDFNSGVYSSIVKGEATGQIHLDGILETAFECSCYLIFFLWKFYTLVNLSLPAINQKHSCYITPRIDYCENDSITPKVAGSRHQMKKIALHESQHKKNQHQAQDNLLFLDTIKGGNVTLLVLMNIDAFKSKAIISPNFHLKLEALGPLDRCGQKAVNNCFFNISQLSQISFTEIFASFIITGLRFLAIMQNKCELNIG